MTERTPLYEPATAAGAVFIEESGLLVPDHFGDSVDEYNRARTAAILVDDSPRGKVEVRGVDAARFLHNLSTNDVLGLPPGGGCEAFLTTLKAKIIAYLLIYRHAPPGDPSAFSLDVAPGAADNVIAYLDRYLISEQVEFADRSRAFAQIHLAGPQTAAILGQLLGETPLPAELLQHGPASFIADAGSWLRRHDALGLPGYDIVCPAEHAASIWEQLMRAGARPAGRQTREILRIEAGLPRESADIDANTFAPEVGRNAEAICYTKGCYLGQESIVMARDRGQINRGLVGVKLPAGPVPRDTPLLIQEKQLGRVTSSAFSPRLGIGIGLGYVRRGHQEPGTPLEVELDGHRAPAEVVELPMH